MNKGNATSVLGSLLTFRSIVIPPYLSLLHCGTIQTNFCMLAKSGLTLSLIVMQFSSKNDLERTVCHPIFLLSSRPIHVLMQFSKNEVRSFWSWSECDGDFSQNWIDTERGQAYCSAAKGEPSVAYDSRHYMGRQIEHHFWCFLLNLYPRNH